MLLLRSDLEYAKEKIPPPLKKFFIDIKFTVFILVLFSSFINMLLLLNTFYVLQVLDRVLSSNNLNTLLMLSIAAFGVYLFAALMSTVRSLILVNILESIDEKVAVRCLELSVNVSSLTNDLYKGDKLVRDFHTLKSFISSPLAADLFDLPWTPVYIFALFTLHPYLGYIGVIGLLLVSLAAILNTLITNRYNKKIRLLYLRQQDIYKIALKNADSLMAMGMVKDIEKYWSNFQDLLKNTQKKSSYSNVSLVHITQFIRNILQMLVLGVGAYLFISFGEEALTSGGMIVSSIILTRAFMPFNNIVSLWRNTSDAINAYSNLNNYFNNYESRAEGMPMFGIQGHLSVRNLYFVRVEKKTSPSIHKKLPKYLLENVSFDLKPGESLGIIGPSGSGKSTLAKILLGIWPASAGEIRLDSVDIYTWNRLNFGEMVGYLPQNIELFEGTIAQNIARMHDSYNIDDVIKCAKDCHIHEIIEKLPDGYDHKVAAYGENLSGGQRQLIALARCFYGSPKFVILDEPNSNLDLLGEQILQKTVETAKKKNITYIIISHRKHILNYVDREINLA